MDAELFSKGLKMICSRHNPCGSCPLYNGECCVQPYYQGIINPVPIVEQWLAERQPKPLPELPPKIYSEQLITLATLGNKINAVIDYLESRAEKGVKK